MYSHGVVVPVWGTVPRCTVLPGTLGIAVVLGYKAMSATMAGKNVMVAVHPVPLHSD